MQRTLTFQFKQNEKKKNDDRMTKKKIYNKCAVFDAEIDKAIKNEFEYSEEEEKKLWKNGIEQRVKGKKKNYNCNKKSDRKKKQKKKN